MNKDRSIQRIMNWDERLPLYRDKQDRVAILVMEVGQAPFIPQHHNCRCVVKKIIK